VHFGRGWLQAAILDESVRGRSRTQQGALMTKAQMAAELDQIIRNQLDDCERAIKAGTKRIALNELEDAVRRLKRLTTLLLA
jgi:3-deoxy-D-manno-octulosonic acid (KDO) 8-phosphate synthase